MVTKSKINKYFDDVQIEFQASVEYSVRTENLSVNKQYVNTNISEWYFFENINFFVFKEG